jgi:MFS family permease
LVLSDSGFNKLSVKMISNIYHTYIAAYKGLPKSVWLLSLVILVNRSGSIILFFLVLYLTNQLNYTVSEAGRMISVYGLGSLAGSYLGGWLSDRIGVLRVMMYSLLLSAAGYIFISYVTHPLILTISLFLVAIVAEAFRPANSTALAAVCPPEIRARGFSLNRIAVNLGVTIGPAAGGFLALISYRLIFWLDAVTCLIAAVLTFFVFNDSMFFDAKKISKHMEIIKSPFKDYFYLLLLLLLFFTGIIFVQLLNTWPLYLNTYYGLIEDQIGLLFAINGIMIVLFELPLIHSVERKNTLKVMTIGAMLFAGGFALLPLSTSYLFAAGTVVIWTFGEMLVFPLVTGLIANRASDNNRGRYMGMFSFTFAMSFVAGPALGSWIYDEFGAHLLWFSAGILGVLITTAMFFLNRYFHQ